jgi:amino acid transporter
VVALATLVPALVLALRGVAVFDIFGWIGSFASYGFILSYILVSLAVPIYLYTHHSPSIATVLSAVAAIVLLLIALIGNLYPVPAAPYNWLPYLFLGYLALGVAWFAALRWIAPEFTKEIQESISATKVPFEEGATRAA